MLIKNKVLPTAGSVVSFRILNGEEIIARLVEMDDKHITVTKPIVASIQMTAPNQAALAFAPFMASVDEDSAEFRFPVAHCLSVPLATRTDIAQNYMQMTTGLEVPASGLIGV